MNISEVNTAITLDFLIKKPENQYFERKSKETKASKIAEEIIGMLNADGGVLAFGITDNGEIEDINTLGEEKLNNYRTLVYEFIHPTSNVELEEIFIDDKLIFLYHTEQDVERVFSRKDNENVYLRKTDKNIRLNREQVKKLEYDKNIRKFEEESVQDFDFEDLDMKLLQSYKEKINYKGSELELLNKKHLAKRKEGIYTLNNSAILLFSQDPEKYIPSASVRYIRYQGTEALSGSSYNVIKDERFEYNIPTLITIDNIKTERFARNPRIARILEDMGYVRQLNEGVPRIYESMEASMLSEPEYKVVNGNVYLTLTNKIKNHSQTIKESVMIQIETNWKTYNETQQKILQYLFVKNKATISELAESLEMSNTTVRDYLKQFINDNIIERKSQKLRDKNALYVFNNE